MKFIHTSDLHLGATPDKGCAWASERKEAIANSLNKIIEICNEKRPDYLFITGNLFDVQPTVSDCEAVNDALKNLEAAVIITAGNVDYAGVCSPVKTFSWNKNIIYLFEKDSKVIFEDAEIRAIPWTGAYEKKPIVDIPLDKKKINILLSFTEDKYENADVTGYDYVALGGKNKTLIGEDNSFAYPGTPEPLGPEDTGVHGVLYGIINENTHKVTVLDVIPVAKTKYVSLVVSVSTETKNGELIFNLKKEMQRRGDKNIYRIKLRGKRKPEKFFSLEELKNEFRISEIIDETEPAYDFGEIFRNHPSDMVGFFVKDMNKKDMSVIEKKALYYGVSALLKTTAER